MPELPEVETVRRGLHELIIGRKITAESHDTPKGFPNAVDDVKSFLIASTVTDVRRRAKVLMIDLSTEYTLVIHLKMTGQLVFRGKNASSSVSSGEQSFGAKLSNELSRTNGTAKRVAEASSQKSATSQDGQSTWSIEQPDGEVRWGAGHPNESLIGELPDRSTRVTLTFEDGSHLYFNDQRKFGWMRLIPTLILNEAITGSVPESNTRKSRSAQQAVQTVPRESTGDSDAAVDQELSQTTELGLVAGKSGTDAVIDFMQKVGPEPLEADFTAEEFAARFKRRVKSPIKAALLDQTVVAGVGNIYADESLWGAKLHPLLKVAEIPNSKFQILYTELRSVMNLAIEKGGSTDKNYVNAEGKRGSYMDFARVFRREGKPCPRCGTIIVKFKAAGRGTHICPNCQKL